MKCFKVQSNTETYVVVNSKCGLTGKQLRDWIVAQVYIVCVCMCVHVWVCVCMFCLSVRESVCLSVCRSVGLSVHLYKD